MEHELKTDADAFDAVKRGEKKFEIRFNDRNFNVGDLLKLRKTVHTGAEMKAGLPLYYEGEPFFVWVSHILLGPIYGLMDGWVIMSIEPPTAPTAAKSEQIIERLTI